jgi:hypothetical protein
MYPTASAPQYAFGPTLAPVPMPMYKGGGNVQQTYGLRNAAEQLRERGRGDDTILAHINPQEAGILKLLGGSGTINPYTGLPEYGWFKETFGFSTPKVVKSIGDELYRTGSRIGKGIESGVESIAKALGPVGQIAAAYFGGPIGAAIYAGLAPEGSSFDVKGAAKAAALTYAGQQLSQGLGQAGTPMGEAGAIGSEGASMSSLPYGAGDLANQQFIDNAAGFVGDPTYYPSVEAAVSSAASTPPSYSPYPDVAEVPTFDYGRAASDISGASADPNIFQQGYDAVKQGYNTAADTVEKGIRSVIPEPIQDAYGATRDFVKDLIPPNYREALSTAKDIALIGSGATTAYGMYQTKKELDAAKEEANRILADQANRKKEEVEWAQGVMRDYPYNYQRLTEEEVRSERGMAMGGRINSYDDEIGGDDNMMQGGIASLAKGGLPPRYIRGGGDGMSDSIRARISGKQEARLADGEFVVPADVVSHLGNGSSNAGAKKLYSMMDRVRKSRTGKTRQAPEVNTRRLMPA